MQSRNQGWAAFDVDNDAYWLYDIPFCDFGAVIDPPSVDVTAHVVELLAQEPEFSEQVETGVEYILRAGAGRLLGTLGRQPCLRNGRGASGSRGRRGAAGHPAMRSAVAWFVAHQNDDGGFGEDCRSYNHAEAGAAWRGRGLSTASQTAWALIALVAADERARRPRLGLLSGCAKPARDGDWEEEHFTGTGFLRDFLIRYTLIASSGR